MTIFGLNFLQKTANLDFGKILRFVVLVFLNSYCSSGLGSVRLRHPSVNQSDSKFHNFILANFLSVGYECYSGSLRSNSLKLTFVSTSSTSSSSKGSSSSSFFTGFQRRTEEEDRVKASPNRPKEVSREHRQGKAATLATLTSDAASMASSYHDRSDFDSRGLTSFLSSSTLPTSSETLEEEENSVLLSQLLGRYATFLENTKGYTAEVSGEPDKELTREKFKGPNIIEEDIATDLEEVQIRGAHYMIDFDG